MSDGPAVQALLARRRRLRAAASAAPALEQRLLALRRWQAARLARTYADLAGDPRYAPALHFFLSDLYGPELFAARDRQLLRAWRYLRRALPAPALALLARALELEVLSEALDQALVASLTDLPVTASSYAQAYGSVGRRDERERQIALIGEIGASLAELVGHAWLGRLLRAAHLPAHAAGFGALQDFLERGLRAFRAMPEPRRLLETVRSRETQLMNTLLAGGALPASMRPSDA